MSPEWLSQGSDKPGKPWKIDFLKNLREVQGKYGFLEENQGKCREYFSFKTLWISLLMFDIGNLGNF